MVENKSFPAKEMLSISTGSSKVSVTASRVNQISVEVVYTYSTAVYRPVFIEKDDVIELEEDFSGPSGPGKATWSITVPFATSVRCSSGSGEIIVEGVRRFVDVNTGSGNAVLNYGGNTIKGFFEFTADEKRGKIVSPFDFDNESTYMQSGRVYMRKSFTRSASTPKVTISTGSGTAELIRR